MERKPLSIRNIIVNTFCILSFCFLFSCEAFKVTKKTPHRPSKKQDSTTEKKETVLVPLRSSVAQPTIDAGVTAIKEGNFVKAQIHFQEAISLDPQFGPGYYWLAYVKYKVGQYRLALDLLDKAEILLKNIINWKSLVEDLKNTILTNHGTSSSTN